MMHIKEFVMKKLTLLSILTLSVLSANVIHETKYVKVKSSHAIYDNVRTQVPYDECHYEQIAMRNDGYDAYDTGYSNYNTSDRASTILGGAIGGVLGHQVGKGRGKTAATIGGAVLGSILGGNMGNRQREHRHRRSTPPRQYENKRVCHTRYEERSNREFVGYKNVGYYHGKKIEKISDRRLSQIPLEISISY